jgi:hypothetical protein
MKKTIFIVLAVLVLIFGAIIVLPSLFKDEIKNMAVDKANSSMDATFSYSDFNLSLIKSFPDFTATFLNVSIVHKDSYVKDTLISISELSAQINLSSILLKRGIVVEKISIDNLYLNCLANKVNIHLKTVLFAEHDKFNFKFIDGLIKINDQSLSVTGGFSMPSDSLFFDMQFENSLSMNATFNSIMTDPDIDIKLNGTIDLEKLTKIFPVDSVKLKGLITANARFSGKISDIKSSNFDEFVSTGYFNLKDVYWQNSSLSMSVSINQGIAELKNRNLKIAFKQLLYDQISITDLNGNIGLNNHQLILSDLGMNILDGTLKMNGTIMANGNKKPVANINLDVKGFDLPSAYRDLSIVQKYLPFAQKTEGEFSTAFKLYSELDTKLNMILSTITANGSFSTNNVKMIDAQSLNSLKSVIQPSKLKNLELDNFSTNFEIKDGNFSMNPFKTAFADQPIAISGVYNMGGTLDYRIDATLDKDILSNDIQSMISYLPGHESIKKVDVGVNLSGDIKKPDVKIDTEMIKKQVIDQVKKSSVKDIKDAAKKLLEKFLK